MAAGLKALSEAKPKAQAEVSAKSSAILSEAERKRRLRLAERTYPFYHIYLMKRVEARPPSGHTEHSAGDCDVSNTSWIAQRSERQKKFCFLMAEQTAKCLHLHRRVSLFFCCRRYAEVPTLAPQEPDGSFGRVQARDTEKRIHPCRNASISPCRIFFLCQCTLKTAYCKREDMTAERSANVIRKR